MSSGRITELRLTSFKSYSGVTLPLANLTVLIGRNGSGKSNALDALEILSRLARGDDVRDAIEGNRRETSPIRGGLDGCAPDGSDTFTIGVTVETGTGDSATLDLTIRVSPQVQVISERLCGHVDGRWHTLVESQEPGAHRSDLDAVVWNGKTGRNPKMTFRSSHLLSAQVPLRLGGTAGEKRLLEVVTSTLAVLGGVFHLDPVPHLMRQYVPEQDFELRRSAENLSAAVGHLKSEDRPLFDQLVQTLRTLPEYEVRAVDVGRGSYGDVMLALKERRGRRSATIPARQMSDGMLRMLAIATALLTGGGGVDLKIGPTSEPGALVLVIEELENGLHPSQAGSLLGLIREASQRQDFQVVLTTHSPALLNALDAADHAGVLVVGRERTSGASSVQRLTEMPGYLKLLAGHRLGDATAEGRLADAMVPVPRPSDADLDRMLGLS